MTKNPHAVALGRKGGTARAKAMTAEELAAASKAMNEARNLLPAEERSRLAKLAAQARWKDHEKAPIKRRSPRRPK